jgi:hypothetical protein
MRKKMQSPGIVTSSFIGIASLISIYECPSGSAVVIHETRV